MQQQARWPQRRPSCCAGHSFSSVRPAHLVQQRAVRGPRLARAACSAALPSAAAQQPFWSSFVSRRINLDLAIEEAVAGALREAQLREAELCIVFLSSAYAADYSHVVQQLREAVPSLKYIVGSSGYGVIGSTDEGPEEIEHAPAVSITLARLPGVSLHITHVTPDALPDGDAPPHCWAQLLGVQLASHQPTSFIILADPEFGRLMELTAGLDFAFRGANKIGGLTSAGKMSPLRAMFAWSADEQQQQQQQVQPQQQQMQPPLNGHAQQQAGQQQQQQQQQPAGQQQHQQQAAAGAVLRTGAVVLALQGPVEMELLVAQGCRPLSASIFTIDEVAGHSSVVVALRDAKGQQLSPVEALQRELRQVASSRSELLLLLRNIALGLMPETLRPADEQPLEPQDFLIRGMALDRAGFMVVGDSVRVGQRVRFMVRDREGAQQDLTSHCLAHKRRELAAMMGGSVSSSSASASASAGSGDASSGGAGAQQATAQAARQRTAPFGMLLFSCSGRGMDLYNEPSYDSRMLASYIPVPVSGFMCNGEIGTISGTTHLHGFTCAAAVLRAAVPAADSEAPPGSNAGSSSGA